MAKLPLQSAPEVALHGGGGDAFPTAEAAAVNAVQMTRRETPLGCFGAISTTRTGKQCAIQTTGAIVDEVLR